MLSIPRIRHLAPAVVAVATLALAVPAVAAAANQTLTVLPSGEGSVSANEPPVPILGKVAGCEEFGAGECEAEYVEGDTVVLVATPADGWEVEEGSWINCTELATDECEVEMSEDVTVEVAFVHAARTLTVQPSGEGEVNAEEPPVPLSGEISGCEEFTPSECEAEYVEGDTVVLVATPADGWEVEEGSWINCTELATDECEVEMSEDVTVEVNFVEAARTLTVQPSGEGEVDAEEPPIPLNGEISECEQGGGACEAEYVEGDTVVLVATPADGWEVEEGSWTNCTELATDECEVEMSEDVTVEVAFVEQPTEFDLEVEVSGEGEVNANEPPAPISGEIAGCEEAGGECEATYAAGAQVTLVATPETGWETASWSGCTVLTPNTCKVTMNADKAVEVEFEEIDIDDFDLEVEVSGEGEVNANEPPFPVSGEISGCEEFGAGECEATYAAGAQVTLVATPETGWETASWSGCTVLTPNTCKVTMNADKAVEVEFEEIDIDDFDLEVEVSGEGEVNANEPPAPISGEIAGCEEAGGECEATYAAGAQVTLVATPETGWETASWSGCTVLTPNTCKVTMNADKAVEVEFEEIDIDDFDLEVEVSGEGEVNANEPPAPISGEIAGCEEAGGECEATYAAGAQVTLVATPETGWETASWSGCTVLTPNTCKVTMNADKAVEVEFEEIDIDEFTLTIAKNGTGTGTVQCKVNGGSATTCALKYTQGTSIELVQSANSGSQFAGWGGDCSGQGACSLTMNGTHSVTATFNASGGGGGGGNGGGGGGGNGGGGGGGATQEGTAKVAGSATVKNGKAELQVTCSGGPCKGQLQLVAKVKQGKKTKNLVIGKSSFNLAAGAKGTLKVKLSGPAKQELAKGKTVKAKVQGTGVAQSTVKLKNAKKKGKHQRRA